MIPSAPTAALDAPRAEGSVVSAQEPAGASAGGERTAAGFAVELENFSGPFDLLLELISRRRLDVTEIALAEVTDEFVAYATALRGRAELEELSRFLVVAATLLDLKTARLLPQGEVEDELDLELLEARDLLFARLLQYRAYKAVSQILAEQMASASVRAPRVVPLEEEFADILPPLEISATPAELAAVFAGVLARDRTPPSVALDHLHAAQVSVAEQRARILALLRPGERVGFAELCADAESRLVVVARFLALLELYRAGACDFEQRAPLGDLSVIRAGDGTVGIDLPEEDWG